eukprot:Tamp_21031.p1 GENE.Tamp_21031~~Tamp_21031.p1  ORF type:complete len:175 (+),score=33.69 Tamp_21031:2-526(+)
MPQKQIFCAVALMLVGAARAWMPLSGASLPAMTGRTRSYCRTAGPRMQASNAGEALKRLAEVQKAKVALSKYETYTVRLKKPMGLVFQEFQTVARGLYVADKNREATNPDNLRPYSDTPSCPFDEVAARDTLIKVDDMRGSESDARCLDFDTAIALIAQNDAPEMELTFAATGV